MPKMPNLLWTIYFIITIFAIFTANAYVSWLNSMRVPFSQRIEIDGNNCSYQWDVRHCYNAQYKFAIEVTPPTLHDDQWGWMSEKVRQILYEGMPESIEVSLKDIKGNTLYYYKGNLEDWHFSNKHVLSECYGSFTIDGFRGQVLKKYRLTVNVVKGKQFFELGDSFFIISRSDDEYYFTRRPFYSMIVIGVAIIVGVIISTFRRISQLRKCHAT